MLGPYRVLDLTDERGWFAGFMLAQMGADVVLVEPEGGRPRDGQSGYHHEAYNRGKRSVVAPDPDRVAELAADADIVLHNDSLPFPVDLAALRAASPGLITVSVSAWGDSGPKAGWRASDLTLFASSGQLIVTGDSDRPPCRVSIPQAWLHGAAQAAVGAQVALEHRARTGRGQHVDVSTQQAVCETALSAVLYAPAGLEEVQREAGGVAVGPVLLRTIYECVDGYAVVTVAFGPMIGPMFRRYLVWANEEGFCDRALVDKDWVDFAIHLQTGEETIETLEEVMGVVAAFTRTKTKAELQERGLRESLLICPVNDLQDVLDSPQLAAREFWDDVDGTRHPGRMVIASDSPLAPLGLAPSPGEHDAPAAHATDPTLASLRELRVTLPEGAPTDRPLAGMKVADLAWVAAAPLATKILAHWGAEVIRVESQHRPCLLRGALGHRDDINEQENAIAWHSANANKKTIALDLSKEESRQTVRDLAAWADVVTESFTPGTMAKLGLGYDTLSTINPELIMVSSCVMGQTGPARDFAGFGNMAASVAGFFDITGWSDRGPAGPYLAYTDYCSPRFTVSALLAAVDHRRRTGQGQHLDFSQMEAAVHFLTPALLELQDTGHKRSRRGNDDDELVPHGVYRTAGEDEWIAVAVQDDGQWKELCSEMRRDDLADLDTEARRAKRSEVDEAVSEWVAGQNGPGLMHRLQAHGINAHHVQNSGACLNDPQLVHRNHFQWMPHDFAGTGVVDGVPYTLSEARNGFEWAGPTYGEYTMEILMETLGYDGDRIAELAVAEALE